MSRRHRSRPARSAASLAAMVCIWWTLRSAVADLRAEPARRATSATTVARCRRGAVADRRCLGCRGLGAASGCADAAAPPGGRRAGAFFGAGAALLARVSRSSSRSRCGGRRAAARRPLVGAVPARPAQCRRIVPGRSVLAIAVIAAATFILISVGAFRRDGARRTTDRALGRRRLFAAGRTAAAARARSEQRATAARRSDLVRVSTTSHHRAVPRAAGR